MPDTSKPFVQLSFNAVDALVFDPEGRYDPESYDRYETFVMARDAALTSIEVMLDEGDYDDETHREELEQMRAMLEMSESYEDLKRLAAYRKFLRKLSRARSVAA
jgi:hypothetical protein